MMADETNHTEDQEKLKERKPQCRINLQPMEKWLEEDVSYCRPCILPVAIDWYHQELTEKGHADLAEELDRVRMTLDSSETCKVMDNIKDRVPVDLRHQLLDFDCATQEFAAEEEGALTSPDEVSPESSQPESHNPDIESEIPPEPLLQELPEIEP